MTHRTQGTIALSSTLALASLIVASSGCGARSDTSFDSESASELGGAAASMGGAGWSAMGGGTNTSVGGQANQGGAALGVGGVGASTGGKSSVSSRTSTGIAATGGRGAGGAVATGGKAANVGATASTGGSTATVGGAVSTGGRPANAGGSVATGGSLATGGGTAQGTPSISPSGYVKVVAGSVTLSGYVSSYVGGSGSSVTLSYTDTSFCAKGAVGANATYNSWAGVGFNVNQMPSGSSGSTGNLVLVGTSITVRYTNPGGSKLEFQLWDGSQYWCSYLPASSSANSVTIPFSSLKSECWANAGTTFTSGTTITTVQLVVPGSATIDVPFDYCFLGMTVQ